GLNPLGYHVLSVLLHAFNALIIFYILRETGAERWPALAGATLFTIHPLLTGAVSYLARRSSLLCGTFYFLAILGFLKGIRPGRPWIRALWFGVAILSAALAWGTKQEAITLPLFLALLLWIRSGAPNWKYAAVLLSLPVLAVFAFRRELTE